MPEDEKQPQPLLDLEKLAALKHLSIQLATENPEKTAHELEQAAADKRLERIKDGVLFFFGLGGMALIGAFSFLLATSSTASADDKKWAQTVLFSIASGAVAYVFGKKSK